MANLNVGKAIKAFYLQPLKVRIKRDNKKGKKTQRIKNNKRNQNKKKLATRQLKRTRQQVACSPQNNWNIPHPCLINVMEFVKYTHLVKEGGLLIYLPELEAIKKYFFL